MEKSLALSTSKIQNVLQTSRTSIIPNANQILMDKLKELYDKLQIQIQQNSNLAHQNQQLKKKNHLSHPKTTDSIFLEKDKTLFNMFIDRISTLQKQNLQLKSQLQITKKLLSTQKSEKAQMLTTKFSPFKLFKQNSNLTTPYKSPNNSNLNSPRKYNQTTISQDIKKLTQQKTKRTMLKIGARKSIEQLWHSPQQIRSNYYMAK